ncbi:MAG: hypothetical protein LBP30_04145 [Clostridiales Family XIII bacterium]|jgi:hypothetical protein|nr:hypothetical protein [Clostridiales Family XIII bacterium]
MNTRTALAERLKNILLVVLVLSTILLLYFLWNDNASAGFRIPGAGAGNAETIPVEDVLYPERVIVNFGAENYTVTSETASLWYGAEGSDEPAFMRAMQTFLASDNIAVGAISKEDFLDVMRARSIRADFSFAIPAAEFCSAFELPRPAAINSIDVFTGVAYSEASPESLLLCDGFGDRYYRLAVDGDAGFKDIIAFVETAENASYYPLRTFSGVENDTMLPLEASGTLTALPYARNIDPSDEDDAERLRDMTRTFFGKSFDFTRKITEGNGTIVYMYGYGEKVLVINRDGSFEYSAAEAGRGGTADFFGALTTALSFVASHGEPEGRATAQKRIYLKDARSSVSDGQRTYGFSFGLKLDGHTVHYADSEPLTVEVTGRAVRYYKRDMIDAPAREQSGETPAGAAFAPFDLLTEHFARIYGALLEKGLAAPLENVSDDERVFERVAEMVTGLSSGLLRPAETLSRDGFTVQSAFADERNLLPVWVLSVGGVDFYFDFYTGAPAGYYGE